MEFIAYIHSALAHEQSLQGIELEPPLNCCFQKATLKSIKSTKLLLSVSLAVTALIGSLNVIPLTEHSVLAAESLPEISILQSLLADKGFEPGPIDGVKGQATTDAIVRAQNFYGLTPDGVVGSETLAALRIDTVLNDSSSSFSQSTADLQSLLANRGFYTGAIDGVLGSGTKAAIIAAQKYYGLTTDGIAGSATLAALQEEPSVSNSQGSTSSDEVVQLQKLLAQRGFFDGPVTGVLGSITKDAIIAAQKYYGLRVDGIAGPATLAALEGNSNSSNSSSTSTVPSTIVSNGEVVRLQTLLAQRGFYNGAIDGLAGSSTKAAVTAAQKFYGLVIDGIAGPATLAALQAGGTTTTTTNPFPNNTNSNSNTRNEISNVQNLLTDRGFYNGPIDGLLGSGTRAGIVAAQRYYGLAQDGVPGPTTIAALENNANQVNRPTTPPVNTPSTPTTASVSTRELQKLLSLRGFYTGTADGSLSNETKNSIIRAQNFYGIAPADGNPTTALVDNLNRDPFVANSSVR